MLRDINSQQSLSIWTIPGPEITEIQSVDFILPTHNKVDDHGLLHKRPSSIPSNRPLNSDDSRQPLKSTILLDPDAGTVDLTSCVRFERKQIF